MPCGWRLRLQDPAVQREMQGQPDGPADGSAWV
jgi:hypothetical protein